MIEIQIAGAGAGKTFNMAKKIVESYDAGNHKSIFAITYTNSAAKEISDSIIKILEFLPDTIKVQTVHAFLLNEIIYPYSPFVLGETYTNSSRCQLVSENPNGRTKTEREKQIERRSKIKALKEKGIMHVEETYSAAWRIVDEAHSKHTSKLKKKKVRRVLEILSCCIETIFLDESQDLDATALKIFKELGEKSVNIYMVGDPKQAIKHPNSLNEFLKGNKNNDLVKILPNNNTSRRVPANVLNLSNRFCPRGQNQTSLSETVGRLCYISSDDVAYDELLNHCIQSGGLVSIYQKTGDYSTRSAHSKPEFDPDIETLLIDHNKGIDQELLIGAARTWLGNIVSTNSMSKSISIFIKTFNIPYSRKTYAQLCQAITSYESSKENSAKYAISSIYRTKGLEHHVCILVLTPSIHRYLMKKDIKNSEKYNKMWNMVYVALTRTKENLIIAVDKEVMTQAYSYDTIISDLQFLGFTELDRIGIDRLLSK